MPLVLNIIGAGDGDAPELFHLYIGQALDLEKQLEQHHNPAYRTRFP